MIKYTVGCDEVGRGCLSGPVVAAAVILFDDRRKDQPWYSDIKDSKALSPVKRSILEKHILKESVAWGIGIVSSQLIDKINIHNASLLAMRKAVLAMKRKLPPRDGEFCIIVDGKFIIPNLPDDQKAIVKADVKVLAVSAASIVAKVYRDRLMLKMHAEHPQYGWDRNKGYATEFHRRAIKNHGLVTVHRRSFCGNIL